jgi:ATPase subunit of ABC transporter with duplicated ATPase domains
VRSFIRVCVCVCTFTSLSAFKLIHFPTRTETVHARATRRWRMRVQIAKALLSRPDVLLLDEPTNHLDLHGVLWLEGYLSRGAGFGMALVVSHDRDFQCAVATDVLMFESKSLR